MYCADVCELPKGNFLHETVTYIIIVNSACIYYRVCIKIVSSPPLEFYPMSRESGKKLDKAHNERSNTRSNI